MALQVSELWPTALLPSKPNSHLERIPNNLRWMKWQDLYYRWVFSIPSKLFLNEFLDSVWSWIPWSYWVINSSVRHCCFVRWQRKSDQYSGNSSGQVRRSNGSWKTVERRLMKPNTETIKMMRAQQRQSFKTCREPPQTVPEDLEFLMKRAWSEDYSSFYA